MKSETQYWLSMAGIIIGCLGMGFAIGCHVVADRAKREIDGLRKQIERHRRELWIERQAKDDIREKEILDA